MKKTTYIVYRHGSNAANQSLTQTAVVGFEDAADAGEAVRQMARRTEVYNNQYLIAKPVSRASLADREAGDYAEGAREQSSIWEPAPTGHRGPRRVSLT